MHPGHRWVGPIRLAQAGTEQVVGDEPSGVGHEHLEDEQLGAREVYRLAREAHVAPREIDLEVAGHDEPDGFRRGLTTTWSSRSSAPASSAAILSSR